MIAKPDVEEVLFCYPGLGSGTFFGFGQVFEASPWKQGSLPLNGWK